MNASAILAQIDAALHDDTVSADAMRSTPPFCETCDADDPTVCGCCPVCDTTLIERCEACGRCRCDTHPTCTRDAEVSR